MKTLVSDEARLAIRQAEVSKYDRSYFEKEYWKEDHPGASGNRGLSYGDVGHLERFRLLSKAISESISARSILDAGTGMAGLLRALEGNCEADLVGVDASPVALQLASQENGPSSRIRLSQAVLAELPFTDDQFDLVVCLDVLEHIPVFDIEDSLDELFRVCSKTVLLSINTDNAYQYHPTVLSSNTWRVLLDARSGWCRDFSLELNLTQEVTSLRSEYEFFCYCKAME